MLTLAVLDEEHAEPGTEVTFVWGEENGGTRKPTVEPHVQVEIRRGRQPGAVRRDRPQHVSARQLADGARVSARPRRRPPRPARDPRARRALGRLARRRRLGAVPHGLARRRPHDGDLDSGDGGRVHRDEQGGVGEGRPDPPRPRRRSPRTWPGTGRSPRSRWRSTSAPWSTASRSTSRAAGASTTSWRSGKAAGGSCCASRSTSSTGWTRSTLPHASSSIRDLLARFPGGYRHLAYLQTRVGYEVKPDMPGLQGPEVEALYASGAAWLKGLPAPGDPAGAGSPPQRVDP